MASYTVRKFLQSRSRLMLLRSSSRYVASSPEALASSHDVAYLGALKSAGFTWHPLNTFTIFGSRSICSQPSNLVDRCEGPAPVDYGSMLQEDEFQKLADSTIHDLLEKLEEYGDSIDVDGFDIDYGNEVLTLKLGSLGTYVVNKQTPNRQIWLSSPVSGPSRFDWDRNTQAWIYRRNRANLFSILESELEKLCGRPVNLS